MTINEIAVIAGVSRATVSRYLNDGYVSGEKRERIRAAIERTGYAPSASAQTLRSGRTRCVGVVIPKINSDSIARMVAGISRRLSAAGFQLLLACTENDERRELGFLRYFDEGSVDGVILLGTILTPAHRAALGSLAVPSVVLAQDVAGFPCVSFDDYAAGYEAGSLLARKGRSFGVVGVTERDEAVGVARVRGFKDALSDAGRSLGEGASAECGFGMESAREAARALLEGRPEIDSLFCATDTIAAGTLVAARELGRTVPGSLQLCGIGDSSVGIAVSPPLSTVRYRYESAGAEAASMLLERISDRTAPVKSVRLSGELVVRGTTR